MADHFCDHCGESLSHLTGYQRRIPVGATPAVASASHLPETKVVWLCADCRRLYLSAFRSLLEFLAGAAAILFAVPLGIAGLLYLLSKLATR